MIDSVSGFPVRPILVALGADLSTERNGKLRCPFHGPDNNPSASIKGEYFKCFACDAHGDAVRLVMDQEGVEWSAAYRRVEEITGRSTDRVRETPPARGGVSFRGEGTNRRNMPVRRPGGSR